MRSKETIQQELTETRTRLSAYLAREADMLSKDGVQLYTIGSRNLQRSPATGKWVNAGRSAGFTTATTAGHFRSFRYRGRCRF